MRASMEWDDGNPPPRWVRVMLGTVIVAVCIAAVLLLISAALLLVYVIRN